MFRMEEELTGDERLIRLIGRIRAENIEVISAQIAKDFVHTQLDLREVTIVDLEVIRFLLTCERDGVWLVNCAAYIREWIVREAGVESSQG